MTIEQSAEQYYRAERELIELKREHSKVFMQVNTLEEKKKLAKQEIVKTSKSQGKGYLDGHIEATYSTRVKETVDLETLKNKFLGAYEEVVTIDETPVVRVDLVKKED